MPSMPPSRRSFQSTIVGTPRGAAASFGTERASWAASTAAFLATACWILISSACTAFALFSSASAALASAASRLFFSIAFR